MIKSKKYKFIFVKTRKTAGTSVEIYLNRFLGEDDIATPIYPQENGSMPKNYKGFFNPILDFFIPPFNSFNLVTKRFINKEKFFNYIPAVLIRNRLGKKEWNRYFKFTIERHPYTKVVSHYFLQLKYNNKKYSFDEYLKSKRNLPLDHYLYTDLNGEI